MPNNKEIQDINKVIWETVKKHCGRESVARIKPGPEQLQEIQGRLSMLTDDFARIGAAVTPTAVQAALSLNDDTFNRWQQGKASQRDEKGNHVDVTLDKSSLTEEEKQYILDRAEIIKNCLKQGELVATTAAQVRDNRENGGSLFILQNVYGYGQEKGKEQVTFTLEDMLQAYATVKERQAKAGKT